MFGCEKYEYLTGKKVKMLAASIQCRRRHRKYKKIILIPVYSNISQP